MSTVTTGMKGFVVLVGISAGGVLGNATSSWAQTGGGPFGGSVERCSLSGVNPADHPGIFSNPAVARSYGFVQANGRWRVSPSLCGRGGAAGAAGAVAGGAIAPSQAEYGYGGYGYGGYGYGYDSGYYGYAPGYAPVPSYPPAYAPGYAAAPSYPPAYSYAAPPGYDYGSYGYAGGCTSDPIMCGGQCWISDNGANYRWGDCPAVAPRY